jgi:hypothetical protein
MLKKLWEQAERLVQPYVVDGVPVFGGDTVLDAKEVGRGEVDGLAASGDGAVPDADRCDAIIFGHNVGLDGQAVGTATLCLLAAPSSSS